MSRSACGIDEEVYQSAYPNANSSLWDYRQVSFAGTWTEGFGIRSWRGRAGTGFPPSTVHLDTPAEPSSSSGICPGTARRQDGDTGHGSAAGAAQKTGGTCR